VLKSERVHDRRQHPDGVGARAINSLVGPLNAAKKVAAADHNADLGASVGGVGDVLGDAVERALIEPVGLPAHQRLAESFRTTRFQVFDIPKAPPKPDPAARRPLRRVVVLTRFVHQ